MNKDQTTEKLILKPCPFCGSDQISTEITICNAKVFCTICSANFIRSNGRNDGENLNRVLSIWNTRHRENELEASISLDALLEETRALLLLDDYKTRVMKIIEEVKDEYNEGDPKHMILSAVLDAIRQVRLISETKKK